MMDDWLPSTAENGPIGGREPQGLQQSDDLKPGAVFLPQLCKG